MSVSQFLQESEHQVSQCGSQRLIVVAHYVCPVLLQLDQCILCLQMQDVTVCCLFHFHLRDPMLRTKTSTHLFLTLCQFGVSLYLEKSV